jgi:hypothetical protein
LKMPSRRFNHSLTVNGLTVDRETILVLTGLNLASEHFNREARYHHFFDRMTKKSAVVLK